MQTEASRRPRGVMPPSPTTASRSGSVTSSGAMSTSSSAGRSSDAAAAAVVTNATRRNLTELLGNLPSSPKDLLRRIERQRDDIRLLQEENVRLKSREVEVSSLTLKLQQQFAATQSQVEGLKSNIQLQLANPISEEEYNAIEALPEPRRDLLDTVKLGIYRQLGSMRASTLAATKRAAELGTTVQQLTSERDDLRLQIAELQGTLNSTKESTARRMKEVDQQSSHVLELEAQVKDLEAKLKNVYLDQEQFLTAKLTAQVKTDEVARLALRLEEAEMDVQRYKANAECTEQKLDILKSEYYELKLRNGQRVLELESCLKAADEKLKTLGDLELESELFVANLAEQQGGDGALTLLGASTPAGAPNGTPSSYESWMALPRSRKLAHTLVVTKRCLHLENKVASQLHDLEFKDKQISRLQASLSAARDALHNINSPYALVEKNMEEMYNANEKLTDDLQIARDENKILQERLQQRTADVQALCRHRQELLRMKKLLRKLGVLEGYTVPDATGLSSPCDASDTNQGSGRSNRQRAVFVDVPEDGDDNAEHNNAADAESRTFDQARNSISTRTLHQTIEITS